MGDRLGIPGAVAFSYFFMLQICNISNSMSIVLQWKMFILTGKRALAYVLLELLQLCKHLDQARAKTLWQCLELAFK